MDPECQHKTALQRVVFFFCPSNKPTDGAHTVLFCFYLVFLFSAPPSAPPPPTVFASLSIYFEKQGLPVPSVVDHGDEFCQLTYYEAFQLITAGDRQLPRK